MSLITPDVSAIKEDVSPGEYQVRVVDSALGEWEGKEGKPPTKWVKWVLETVNEEDDKNNGRRIWHTTPYTGGGAFRMKNFYKAAVGEDMPVEGGFDTEMLMSKELMVVTHTNAKGYIEVKSESAIV